MAASRATAHKAAMGMAHNMGAMAARVATATRATMARRSKVATCSVVTATAVATAHLHKVATAALREVTVHLNLTGARREAITMATRAAWKATAPATRIRIMVPLEAVCRVACRIEKATI